MPTPAERNALIFLAGLAALGLGVRGFRATRGPDGAASAADTRGVNAQIAAVDSATAGRGRADRRRKGAAPQARPGAVRGESSAARTFAPPGASRREASLLPPGATPGAADPLALSEARRRAVEANNADARRRFDSLGALVRGPPARAAPGRPAAEPATTPVDLDTADEAAIAGLPWIGPSLAARIVDDRMRRGPFGSFEGLQRVRGIGPGLAGRLRRFVTFSRPLASPAVVIPFRKNRK